MLKIIMLGDSLINWNYNSPYENYGKNGYRSRDVYWLLNSRKDIIGDIGILLVGVNDFFTNTDFIKVQEYYIKIIEEMKKRFKDIILISLLPTDRKYVNEKIKTLNNWLEINYPQHYLNIYNYFLNDLGEIKKEYTTDGIHLNHTGYNIFNNKLDEEVKDRSSNF